MIPTIILTVFFNWRRGAVRSRLRPQSRFFLSCESLDIALHMHQIVQRNAPPNMGNNYAMQPTMLFVQLIQTVQHSIVRTQQSQNSSSSARHCPTWVIEILKYEICAAYPKLDEGVGRFAGGTLRLRRRHQELETKQSFLVYS